MGDDLGMICVCFAAIVASELWLWVWTLLGSASLSATERCTCPMGYGPCI